MLQLLLRLRSVCSSLQEYSSHDNSSHRKEFSYHEKISKALSAHVYFAHPYSSWERGLYENTNGLFGQYFPKSTAFKKAEQAEVSRELKRLNSRPRKDLNFKTSAQLMGEHWASLAA